MYRTPDGKRLCKHGGKIGEGCNKWSCTLHPANRCHFHTLAEAFFAVLFDNQTAVAARPPVVKVLFVIIVTSGFLIIGWRICIHWHCFWFLFDYSFFFSEVVTIRLQQLSPLFDEGLNIVVIKGGEAISNLGLADVIIQIFSLQIKLSTVGWWGPGLGLGSLM